MLFFIFKDVSDRELVIHVVHIFSLLSLFLISSYIGLHHYPDSRYTLDPISNYFDCNTTNGTPSCIAQGTISRLEIYGTVLQVSPCTTCLTMFHNSSQRGLNTHVMGHGWQHVHISNFMVFAYNFTSRIELLFFLAEILWSVSLSLCFAFFSYLLHKDYITQLPWRWAFPHLNLFLH